MKRLVLSLAVIAALALIVTTGNFEINVHRHSGTSITDGGSPPPPPYPPKPNPPVMWADGGSPPPPPYPPKPNPPVA